MKNSSNELVQNSNGRWVLYWLPVMFYASLIFYLSSLPHPEEHLPDVFEVMSDKFLHFVEYAVFGAFAYGAFRWAAGATVSQYALPLAILAGCLYGLTDEIHQAFVPFRESSWLDWVADTIGAAIGSLGAYHLLPSPARLEKLFDFRTTGS